MLYINVDVDLDLEDLYDELSKREKERLIKWLEDEGYLTDQKDIEYEKMSILEQMFEDDIEKIRKAYFQISKDDFKTISEIAKKY